MATLNVQNLTIAGLISSTLAAASTGDGFANDGSTFLLFVNGSVTARTLTITIANATVNTPGYNPLTIASPTVTLPGSGTNGGVGIVGPFGPTEFNDSNGRVNYTLDIATSMTVAAIKMPRL